MEEIEVKSDIHSILKRIDEYKHKVESDFYADMEEKQYEKNQMEKARLRDEKLFEVLGVSDDFDDSDDIDYDSDESGDTVHFDYEDYEDYEDYDASDVYIYEGESLLLNFGKPIESQNVSLL